MNFLEMGSRIKNPPLQPIRPGFVFLDSAHFKKFKYTSQEPHFVITLLR